LCLPAQLQGADPAGGTEVQKCGFPSCLPVNPGLYLALACIKNRRVIHRVVTSCRMSSLYTGQGTGDHQYRRQGIGGMTNGLEHVGPRGYSQPMRLKRRYNVPQANAITSRDIG